MKTILKLFLGDEFDSNTVMNKIVESPFVEELISFCEKQDFQRYKYLVTGSQEAFKDIYFVTAFQSAFASFLNRSIKDHTIAEIFGRYTEKILKKGNQTFSEVKINYFIENITNLFSYMEDKDLFIEVYRAGLARRLLENKVASIDYEKELIGRIKMCWGPQYTSKVEGMLTDTNAAIPFVKQFQDSDSFKNLPIEFDVKVLTDGYWPSFKSPPVVLPIEINNCIEAFNKFYVDKNKMKHLSWSYMHGKCNVLARYADKEYTLVLTTYQTSIIMLFNDNEELSFKEIKNLLQTEDGLLEMMLDSLCCKKYKLMQFIQNKTQSTGTSKLISREDTFKINEKFKNSLKLISVPAPMIKETFNKEKVDFDRTYAIDAAVVKIMKSRKKMSYMHLLNEVMTILQMFKPTSLMIKNRIETLIDRDYMERDSEDNNVFRYLA